MFSKILIANRGEIAVRIIRACNEMGIRTVAVYSQADAQSLHVNLADESYCIGPALLKDSYLNMTAIIDVAIATGCQAIHPGYGLLSENPRFAELCEKCNIKFIGPHYSVIAKMGDKDEARRTMKKAGVPVVPGLDEITDIAEAKKFAAEIGYPVIVKASAGGGGRGIRIVWKEEDFETAVRTASAEAQSAFGNGKVYLEKYLTNVKHVEMQIVADNQGNVVCLGERDCSMQRKNQKLIEESPCVTLSQQVRREMMRCAVLAAKVAMLRVSVRQIARQAKEKLAAESNVPVAPDSADGCVRSLARELTQTLDEVISLARKYREGDLELKRAVTNVSHDLRTPLTSAAGYAGLLKKSGLNEKQAEYLAVVEGRISAMKRLTDELLSYSVAAADEGALTLAETDIAALLEDSLTQFYAAFEERGISPVISIPEEKVVRIADKDALARVFGNVISNAVRYSDGDFSVTMTKDGEIVFENAASALDEVSTGRLFDRFYTVENARGSTGLGLSIAKIFVEKMGGTIGASWSAGRLYIRIRI